MIYPLINNPLPDTKIRAQFKFTDMVGFQKKEENNNNK